MTPLLLLVGGPLRSVETLDEPWLLPLPWGLPHRGDAGELLPSAVLPKVGGVGLGMLVRAANAEKSSDLSKFACFSILRPAKPVHALTRACNEMLCALYAMRCPILEHQG